MIEKLKEELKQTSQAYETALKKQKEAVKRV